MANARIFPNNVLQSGELLWDLTQNKKLCDFSDFACGKVHLVVFPQVISFENCRLHTFKKKADGELEINT